MGYLSYFSRNPENERLIKNINENVKSNAKRIKWIFGVLFIILLLLGLVYIFYIIFVSNNNVQAESKKDNIKKAINPLYITSVATTNDDYLKQCAPQVKCDPSAKYRSINGSCNNLNVPTWGASLTPFYRIFNANYSDDYYKIRLQTNGSALPNSRIINTQIFLDRDVFHPDENNVFLTPFGQLIAHDVSGMAADIIKDKSDALIKCCDDQFTIKPYPQCQVVVKVPLDDPVYNAHDKPCLEVLRMLTSRNYSCPLYPTTFLNENTHYIDASELYGSNEKTNRKLRKMKGGLLKFSTSDDGQMFCPFLSQNNNEPVQLQKTVDVQYDSGNAEAVNQNLGITTIQTLFLRYHNYIANKLSYLNPQWPDEVIYQESRRIVIATIQHNAYKHFLPIVIGEDFQELYGLNKENIYDPTVIPSIAQEFSSAGFRMLHTLIPVGFNFMNNNYSIESSMRITDWMRDSSLLPKDHNFDKLLKGFLETPGRITQNSYNFDISNFMFALPLTAPLTGIDLMVNDIAIGRDVGLQPYNKVRHLCGLPLAKDFDDLLDSMHLRDINKLKELYHSVNDIDLIVGLILEKRSDGAIVGPTTRCLIADSFYRSKAGDRFFYDVQGQPGSFTPDQLKTIKKITLGHVICASSNVDHIQSNIFKVVDHNLFPTSKLKCGDEFSLNLEDWKEPNYQSEL